MECWRNSKARAQTVAGGARHADRSVRRLHATAVLSLLVAVALIAAGCIGIVRPSWAQSQTSDNIRDFLTSASISGIEADSNGTYHYRDGDEITMKFAFAETENTQFSDTALYYTLPDGFEPVDTSGTFDVPVKQDSKTYVVSGNTWSIKDGKLTITWNQNDPNFTYLTNSSNAHVGLDLKFTLQNVANSVPLSDKVTLKFEKDTDNNVAVAKSSEYDATAGVMHYTVTITSTGTSENVKVDDAISGSAITYDPSTLKVSGNSSDYTVQTNGNGFTFTTPQMNHKEVITLTYDGAIDYSKFGGAVTADNSKNTVTATSDGDSDSGDNTKSTDETGKITISDISKVGSETTKSTDDTTTHTVHWTINANTGHRVSLAGGQISDSISEDSQSIMKYAGTGVTFTVHDASGAQVDKREVAWSDLGVTDTSTATSWSYTVPDTDGKYSYTAEYDTAVNMAGTLESKQVGNSASTAYASTTATATVSPEFDFHTSKSVVSSSSTQTTWQITANAPKAGYDSFVITDTLPCTWYNTTQYCDTYHDGTLKVDGLEGDESYTTATTTDTDEYNPKFIITFYKDAAHNTLGLGSTSADRTITVTLETDVNQTWLTTYTSGGQSTHTNIEVASANGVDETSSASVTPPHHTISKKVETAGTVDSEQSDGTTVKLPLYKYTLTLHDVTGGFDIDDVYDTSLFAYATDAQMATRTDIDRDNNAQGGIYGGDEQWWPDKANKDSSGNAITVSHEDTSTGMTIHVPANALAKDSNGAYYAWYRITYYLVVKDLDALHRLDAQVAKSSSDSTTFTNTATWDGSSSTATGTYTYKTVNKEQTSVDANAGTAQFTLTVNPDGADVNPNGDSLSLEDTMSDNMLPDFSSITSTPALTSYTYDEKTHTLNFVMPDNQATTITYKTFLTGSGDVSYSNTATLYAQTSTVQKTVSLGNHAESGASVPSINLLKDSNGDLSKPLEGAQFQLYNASTDELVTDKVFESNKDGIVRISGHKAEDGWTLVEGTKYYLKEIKAPDGYQLPTDTIPFTIVSPGTTISGADVYPDSYTIPWSNVPEETTPSDSGSLPQTGFAGGAWGYLGTGGAMLITGSTILIRQCRHRAMSTNAGQIAKPRHGARRSRRYEN